MNDKIDVKTIYGLVTCVMKMMQQKLAISQDLLIMSQIFAYYCLENGNDEFSQLGDAFVSLLNDTISTCLTGTKTRSTAEAIAKAKAAQSESKTDRADTNDLTQYFKQRNYLWFKEYLLHSNIWFVKSYSNNQVFFDKALKIVAKGLIKQKQFIWENSEEIKQKQGDLFVQLCQFGDQETAVEMKTDVTESATTGKPIVLRQDRIQKGIIPQADEIDTILMKVEMAKGKALKEFDISFENNTKIYLTQCLTYAHANNARFSKLMKQYFNEKDGCKYQSGSVKLYDRCVIKGTSDYRNYSFPSVANIIDFVRFSVTYNNVSHLLNGLNTFINDINSGNNKYLKDCLVPYGILRIKNRFSDVLLNWKSADDAEYVDIKLNIIYKNENDTQRMIVEAQFLLSFLLKAKKMGHKLYSIVRQEEFINNVTNQVYGIDNNYEKYKGKIYRFIENNDTNNLTKQLFWKPNVVLSMVEDGIIETYRPLLYEIKFLNIKFQTFFLNCLFHFSYILLNERTDNKNVFLKKYFNWNHLRDYIIRDDSATFYGFQHNSHFKENGLVEMIMKQEYFDGFSQYLDHKHVNKSSAVMYCISQQMPNCLLLLLKYYDKNEEWIKKIMSSVLRARNNISTHPLLRLMQHRKMNSQSKREFLKILFDLSDKSNQIFSTKVLQEVIAKCKNWSDDDVNKSLTQTMVQNYINKHNVSKEH